MKLIVVVDNLEHGGIATAVKGFYWALKKNYKIDIDFIIFNKCADCIVQEYGKQNTRIFIIPSFRKSLYFKFKNNIYNILKNNGPYDAIHINIAYLSWIVAKQAKKVGIKNRVGHGHGAKAVKDSLVYKFLVEIGKKLNRKFCTEMFACSDKSGEFTFSYGYKFLPNIVRTELISVQKNMSYYDEFSVDRNDKILGYLGVFEKEKNAGFIVDILCSFSEDEHIKCVMAGDGTELDNVINKVKERGIENRFRFIGYRKDGNDLLKFYDVLIAPSFSEGMSLTLLEAQLTGTPCIVSKQIPKTNNLQLGLYYEVDGFDPVKWKIAILKALIDKHNLSLENRLKKLQEIGYDDKSVARDLYEAFTKW